MSNLWGKDKDSLDLEPGSPVIFVSSRKKTAMKGNISGPAIGQMLQVRIKGDPFSVNVPSNQVTFDPKGNKIKMPSTTTGPSRKELRKQADALGIEGWDTMTTSELEAALAAASKAEPEASSNGSKAKTKTRKTAKAAKKRAAGDTRYDDANIGATADAEDERAQRMLTKAAEAAGLDPDDFPTWTELADRLHQSEQGSRDDVEDEPTPAPKKAKTAERAPVAREVSESGNPFRAGSNLYIITEELLKGGRRAAMIGRLNKKIDLHPWRKKAKDIDLNFEMDKRILLTKNLLVREYGFTFETTGRGAENGTIKAIPPKASKRAATTAESEPKAAKKAKAKKRARRK